MDDNATCHRTLAVQDCLDSEGIQRLVWPARSPDLNPIENVWDALGRQVSGRNYPPTNKNTLIRALTEKWDKLLQQLLDNVVQKALAICQALDDPTVSNKNFLILSDSLSVLYALQNYSIKSHSVIHRLAINFKANLPPPKVAAPGRSSACPPLAPALLTQTLARMPDEMDMIENNIA
ncbi:hypothetical protein TNCV_126941 [Trichonephila clavipes]|nr:hypothetical protein TNCV_126941 [Trichonephila clavipes]